jgi:hypothetical protein
MQATSADRRSSQRIDGMNEDLGPNRPKRGALRATVVTTRRTRPAYRP